jgi:predicted HAD superfamily Cof-like phosphohydrolase
LNDMQLKVSWFNASVGAIRGDTPDMRDAELRARLILEEAVETVVAMVGNNAVVDMLDDHANYHRDRFWEGITESPDLVEAVDGLCDLLYVVFGAFDAFGIDAEPFFQLVHEANMTKANAPKDAHGKVCKPPGFVPPQERIRELLTKMGAK